MKRLIVTATAALTLIAAPSAGAFDPENFGLIPINDGLGPRQEVSAMPEATNAFWAGTCDRSAAPAPGNPILPDTGLGAGIGTYPSTVLSPGGEGNPYVVVAAPSTSTHCIEWGATALLGSAIAWTSPPSWRLPAHAQAGGHPDGSTNFALNRSEGEGSIDGSLDNVVVDLPPGLVGDPGAVVKCTAEQFRGRPLNCPPSSQVGVLHLEIQASPLGGANSPGGSERIYPVYNLEPRRGNAAELGFGYASNEDAVTVRIVAKARTNGDHGVTAFIGQIPAALQVRSQQITIWGVPWAAANDVWRAPTDLRPKVGEPGNCNFQPGVAGVGLYIPPSGLTTPGCAQSYDPSWGPIKPFFSNVTECTGEGLSTRLSIDQFQHPGNFVSDGRPVDPVSGKFGAANGDPDPSDPDWKVYESPAPPMTGCEQVQFHPNITLDPTKQGGAANQATDSPTGLDVELTIPQNELPFNAPPEGASQPEVDQYLADAANYWKSDAGLATSHLKDTVVTLPEGMTLNPSAADGQGVCTMDQIGVTDTDSPEPPAIRFDNGAVECPQSSKVAEVVVETPLLEEADWPKGNVYLAKQGENPFNSDFAIYIAIESPHRGVIVKLAGVVAPDPATGRLTTTFAENPQLPFDRFHLEFKAGPRAPLATPTTCGTHTNVTALAPYSNPGSPAIVEDPFEITSSPAGGCPATREQRPLNLGFSAGSTNVIAGAHTPFTVRIQRGDGNQELDRVEVTTPEGFAANLTGVPYCPESGISQAIGRNKSGDGVVEQSSPSCPAASQVGTTTIGAGAGSQPIYVGGKVYLAGPYKGAPLSLAFVVPAVAGPFDLGVQVVRAAVNVNPKTAQITTVSDAIPQILAGVPVRIRDIRVDIDRQNFALNPTDCAEQLVTGKISGASGATTDVSNRFQVAECTRLAFKPKLSLQLKGGTRRAKYQGLKAVLTARPGDANIAAASVTMPRSAFLAQEHIRTVCTRVQFAADACPKGSIYGKASAVTPLLEQPLSGPVYLRSSDNKLPDLVVALRGPDTQPIEVELSGRTDSVKGALRNTFDVVPDAPVTKFTLELFGGDKGLIVNSQGLCSKTHKATVRLTAQNGRTYNTRPAVGNSCNKARKGKKAKRAKKNR